MDACGDADEYCSIYEVLTKCRFFAVGQQTACRGFRLATYARRCTWWTRLEDGNYRCGNPDSQKWACAQYQQKQKGGTG